MCNYGSKHTPNLRKFATIFYPNRTVWGRSPFKAHYHPYLQQTFFSLSHFLIFYFHALMAEIETSPLTSKRYTHHHFHFHTSPFPRVEWGVARGLSFLLAGSLLPLYPLNARSSCTRQHPRPLSSELPLSSDSTHLSPKPYLLLLRLR